MLENGLKVRVHLVHTGWTRRFLDPSVARMAVAGPCGGPPEP